MDEFVIAFDSDENAGILEDANYGFSINFMSNMMDLVIQSITVFEGAYQRNRWIPQIIGVSAAVFLIIVLFVFFGVRHYQLRKAKKRRNEDAFCIKRPMVLSINIGHYQRNPQKPGVEGIYYNDLEAVDLDYVNMQRMCEEMGCEPFPKEPKYEWTQQEVVNFLYERASELSKNIGDDRTRYQYDS